MFFQSASFSVQGANPINDPNFANFICVELIDINYIYTAASINNYFYNLAYLKQIVNLKIIYYLVHFKLLSRIEWGVKFYLLIFKDFCMSAHHWYWLVIFFLWFHCLSFIAGLSWPHKMSLEVFLPIKLSKILKDRLWYFFCW